MDQLSSYDEKEIIEKKKDKTENIRKGNIFRIIKSFGKLHNIVVYRGPPPNAHLLQNWAISQFLS
jgi:hypothetical protein